MSFRSQIVLALALAACSKPEQPLAIVLISIDTLRPDRLGAYGNTPDVSPAIDALAGESVLFEQALAPAPWTLPSHMSMLTGLDPIAHGVRRETDRLSRHIATLAERLEELGFATGAFTDGGFVAGAFGYVDGFDVYEDERKSGGPNGFARLLPDALDWLKEHEELPYFAFIHTFDVHSPYQDGDEATLTEFRQRPTPDGPRDHALFPLQWMYQQAKSRVTEYGRMSELLNDYDAGVHEADAGVGRILEVLRATGRLDNALVIVTSDHGESFLDHGLHVGHGIDLTDDELHIPLIVRFPRGEAGGSRSDVLVDLLDLVPTALHVAGAPADESLAGESLLALARGEPRRRDWSFGQSTNTEAIFLVRDGFKYVTPIGMPPFLVAQNHLGPQTPPALGEVGEEYEIRSASLTVRYDEEGDPLAVRDHLSAAARLYDREADPGETRNLLAEQPERVETMQKALYSMVDRSLSAREGLADEGAQTTLGVHEAQQLAQLGYLLSGDPQDKAGMSRFQREQLKVPYAAPDARALEAADRLVHRVRLELREGTPRADTASELLQQAGDQYVAWARENQAHQARARWRLAECIAMAQAAGARLQVDDWEAPAGTNGGR